MLHYCIIEFCTSTDLFFILGFNYVLLTSCWLINMSGGFILETEFFMHGFKKLKDYI